MCQLNHVIQNFLEVCQQNEIDITNQHLIYYWKHDNHIYNEEETNELFQAFRQDINDRIGNVDNLIGEEQHGPVYHILDWGLKPHNETNFCNLNSIYSNRLYIINQENRFQDAIDVNLIDRALQNTDERLSSWTKILAAYNPNFYIYDARVAIALMFLSAVVEDDDYLSDHGHPYNWFMPNPGSPCARRMAERIMGGALNHQQGNPTESYRRYLMLLLHQDPENVFNTASQLEKRLFMLGGALRDRYRRADRRHDINMTLCITHLANPNAQ